MGYFRVMCVEFKSGLFGSCMFILIMDSAV